MSRITDQCNNNTRPSRLQWSDSYKIIAYYIFGENVFAFRFSPLRIYTSGLVNFNPIAYINIYFKDRYDIAGACIVLW